MNVWSKIVNIAEDLDKKGLYRLSDGLTNVLRTVCAQQYYGAGPQELDLPMKTRVIPFGEMESEFDDVAKKRKEYHPRMIPKEKEVDDPADMADVYGDEQNGTPVVNQPNLPGMSQQNATGMNQQNKSQPSIFSINGPSPGGISLRVYDPTGAGYMGEDQFEYDKWRDTNGKDYAKLLPH